jgi:hypothetical protein
MLTVKTLT